MITSKNKGLQPIALIIVLLVSQSLHSQLKTMGAEKITSGTFNCDFCMCSQGISPLDFSGKGIRLDPRYLVIDRVVKDGRTIDNTKGSYEKHFTLQASVIYPVTKKFSLIGVLPYSIRDGRENAGKKAIHTSG